VAAPLGCGADSPKVSRVKQEGGEATHEEPLRLAGPRLRLAAFNLAVHVNHLLGRLPFTAFEL